MKEKQTRNTRKSRILNEMKDAIVELVIEHEVYDPSKSQIVEQILDSSLNEGASEVVRNTLSNEIGNFVDNYFSEACRLAGEDLKLPYHYLSKRWYRGGEHRTKDGDTPVTLKLKPKSMPQSYLEARAYVVIFGNGRTSKAAGVRFVTEEDEPDPMYMVCMEKQVNIINSAIVTQSEKIRTAISRGALSSGDAGKVENHLPHVHEDSTKLTLIPKG